MPQILADRFVLSGSQWIDLATGHAVRVRVAAAGPVSAQLGWNSRCAALAGVRHPLINPLVDYGMADAEHTFEAYAVMGPVRADTRSAACLRDHLVRFLCSHHLYLETPVTDYAVRGVATASREQPRPLGISLQPRRAFDVIQDALEAGLPPGASAVAITGEPHCGLRTLRLAAARTARLEGYMPVSASVLRDRPWLAQALAARHVCLFSGDEASARSSMAAALARLAAEGGRRHVVLSFGRRRLSSRSVQVERMGITAMTEMVYIDAEHGPRADRLFDAARASNGRPGEFLARLGATELRNARVSLAVHESVQPYVVPAARTSHAAPIQMAGVARGVLHRAPERAVALARAGRHGAARRLLHRAQRVLTGRGEHTHAAACALQLGWLSLERAQLTDAAEQFGRARELTSHPETTVRAAIGLGIAWTDEGRLTEAEGLLRTSIVGAETMDEADLISQAEAGLARCLLWQGRHDEAAALLQSPAGARVSARELARRSVVLARILMAEGGTAPAVRTAREAIEHATKSGDASVLASAHRALGEAVAGGGDAAAAIRHVREGLHVARRAHLPLQAARLRLTSLDIQASAGASPDARSLATRLAATGARWPALLRHLAQAVRSRVHGEELDEATRAFIDASGAVTIGRPAYSPGPNPVAELEQLLAMCQTATDDRTAILKVCDYLRTRLRAATVIVIGPEPERRVLSSCGRTWHGAPSAAWRTLASGLAVRADAMREPCEASEPLRYSGDVTGAIAARWSAGAVLDPGRAAAMLRVGALAIAANVRAELDRTVPSPAAAHPANEILGDSPPARSMRESIARAARAPFPVLIEGESGSGKELVARAIHRLGPRRDRRFCAINCAALSDELLEAELFGHARGAFTGAVSERAGLFEEADGGTLFLDEIGELSARAQAKLLRVLQDGQVRRVGENMSRRVDVRIVAATNRRLAEEAAAGRFRPDLRFRLDVVRIDVPPLRERAGDVPLLASSFWTEAAARMGSRATLSPETLAALSRYDWPGNVRELQNVIAWMAVHSPSRGRIQAGAVPAHVAQAATLPGSTFEAARSEFERRLVRAALAAAGGHRARAAEALGVTRQGLAKMLRRLGIE
jgi:DNA-binding NtrC family response regulator/tetratricopeptide (TPR) repeat protein